jgi:hypothetical protein
VFLAVILEQCDFSFDSSVEFADDAGEAFSGELSVVVLQYFVGDFPDQGDLASDDLFSDGVEEGLIEVVFEEVADEVVGVVAGGRVRPVVQGQGDPVFALGGLFEDFAVVIGQEGEDTRELEGR